MLVKLTTEDILSIKNMQIDHFRNESNKKLKRWRFYNPSEPSKKSLIKKIVIN
jgi:hypothetical protein